MSQKDSDNVGPHLLGDLPNIDVPPLEAGPEDDEESNSDALPAIKIYDDDVIMRFLVCGLPCLLVWDWFHALFLFGWTWHNSLFYIKKLIAKIEFINQYNILMRIHIACSNLFGAEM